MAKVKKKKGLTRHHIAYNPEIVVEIPSRGAHLVLTSFQSMNPTKENIRLMRNFRRAVSFIIKEKQDEYNIQAKQDREKREDFWLV